MPCYDPETHDRPIRLANKIHHLTRLLCELCTSLDQKYPHHLPCLPEVNEWWLKHQEFDRIGEEIRLKKELHGIESLTSQERSHYYARESNSPETP